MDKTCMYNYNISHMDKINTHELRCAYIHDMYTHKTQDIYTYTPSINVCLILSISEILQMLLGIL